MRIINDEQILRIMDTYPTFEYTYVDDDKVSATIRLSDEETGELFTIDLDYLRDGERLTINDYSEYLGDRDEAVQFERFNSYMIDFLTPMDTNWKAIAA